ncbi:MAG: VWA domain-containing protein [Chloroflexota bacterium]
MPVALESPIALLLLLLLPALYLLGRDRLSLMARWRGRAILGARMASVAAVILALAGPSMPLKDATMSVAFVLDASDSASPATRIQQEEWVRQAIGRMRSTDRAAVVSFAGEPQVTKPLGGNKEYRLAPTGDLKEGSDLSTALQLASGLLPASGLRKIVLLSDGWDSSGKVEQTARSLPAGTRVDVVQWPALEGLPELLVESLDVPSHIREGDGFDVNAVLGSSHETTAQLRILVDGQQTGSWDVQLGKGANLVTMSQKPLTLGFHSVELLLSAPEDTVEENNRAAGSVTVKQRGSVLLVKGPTAGSDHLRQELEASGLQLSQIGPEDFPIQLPLLLAHDAVVLDDVPGPSFTLDQMKTLQAYVRDHGRGLLTVGGRSSYGLGDYVGGPLEEILPVSSETPLSRDRGDMALVLLVDKSGSMDDALEGVTKIDMAREAAIQATSVLKPEDQIAVIAFDTDPTWIVPPQKVGNDLDSIRSRISSLQSSGGTDIHSALQAAYYTALGMQATTRHITLLTDGQSWKGPYQALLQKVKGSRITLSTIGIGSDADRDWLSELARLGDGRAYFTERFSDVPRIVYREVSAATKVAEVNGQVDPQFSSPSPVLRGMNREEMPPLDGYVATKPKDAATVVLKSERGDPLLSQWQYGLGRVVSWTSDAEGTWSNRWISQPTFRRVWDQAVRWTMAPPIDRNLQVAVRAEGRQATLTVDSVNIDGQFVDLADTRAEVWDPEGRQRTIPLRQTAPGRYQATLPAAIPGVYRVEVSQFRGGLDPISETAGFAVPWAPEFRGLGSNDTLLKELAAMTGGHSTRDPADAFSRTGMPASPGWEPLWPYLLAAALLLLPIEVALRRIRSLPFGRPAEEAPNQPAAPAGATEVEDRERAAA